MCGIVGVLGRHPALAEPGLAIQRMCRTLVARGPDADGTYVEPEIALGHRRLAIIDLSGGVQPMQALGGQVVLVYIDRVSLWATRRFSRSADQMARDHKPAE